MLGTIKIVKSFDNEIKEFKKELEQDDLAEFFSDEGKYLDKLVKIMEERGEKDDEFTVTYTVTVKNEV